MAKQSLKINFIPFTVDALKTIKALVTFSIFHSQALHTIASDVRLSACTRNIYLPDSYYDIYIAVSSIIFGVVFKLIKKLLPIFVIPVDTLTR
jgi:uncharacterized membrane protein YvlD (DUF360 family)